MEMASLAASARFLHHDALIRTAASANLFIVSHAVPAMIALGDKK